MSRRSERCSRSVFAQSEPPPGLVTAIHDIHRAHSAVMLKLMLKHKLSNKFTHSRYFKGPQKNKTFWTFKVSSLAGPVRMSHNSFVLLHWRVEVWKWCFQRCGEQAVLRSEQKSRDKITALYLSTPLVRSRQAGDTHSDLMPKGHLAFSTTLSRRRQDAM